MAARLQPAGREWLRIDSAGQRVCSVAAVSRALHEWASIEDVRTSRRLAQLVVFGLWFDAAYLPDGNALGPDQWTRLVPFEIDRLRARLGLTVPEVTAGFDVLCNAGLVIRHQRLNEFELTDRCFATQDGVIQAVSWPRVVTLLAGCSAGLAAARGAAHLLVSADTAGRLPIDTLATVTGYSPNAIRDGLAVAVDRGILVPEVVAGPRRTYRLSDLTLGRNVDPVREVPRTAATSVADPGALMAVEVAGVALRIPTGVDVTVRVDGMEKAVTLRLG